MTTQQQTDQPADLGERVAQVEGGFGELSIRVGTLQTSVDNLRTETHADNAALRAEMQAGFAELRAEMNRFKNQVIFFILGSWVAGGATIGATVIAASALT